jgi:hypothetical protein
MSEFDYLPQGNFENKEKRPTGLTVLAVLTFVGSGFMLLTYLYVFGKYDVLPQMLLAFAEAMSESMGESFRKVYEQTAEMITNTNRSSFLYLALSYLCSIAGAGFMLAMRKAGFHLYAIGQILVLTLPMILMKNGFPTGELLLSIAFIGLYFMYYKKFK